MNLEEYWKKVRIVSDEVLQKHLKMLSQAHSSLTLNTEQQAMVSSFYDNAWEAYVGASKTANDLAKKSLQGDSVNTSRSSHFSKDVAKRASIVKNSYVAPGFLTVLGGVTITKQIGSLKYVFLDQQNDEPVIDIMSSAATLNLGAGFPLFKAIDLIESILGIGENIGLLYHAGAHHSTYFEFLKSLHPNQMSDPFVFAEHSGTAVNSVSIEAATAHAESLGLPKTSKLLAFNGTWSGGFGTAKEASGFGAAKQFEAKTGLQWIDRSLEVPRTKSDEDKVLQIIKEKISTQEASGIVFEKIVGDAGVIELSDNFVSKMLKLFEQSPNGALPVIVDDIHAGNARSSSDYWSFSKESGLRDYPKLILTNAKSSAGGKPYGFALIPKAIVDSAYSYSMLTTHSGNGAVGRAVAFAQFITDPRIAAIKNATAKKISGVFEEHSLKQTRGRHFNRAIVTNDAQELELLQNYLFVQYGILAGSFPAALRFQPNVIEYPETLTTISEIICKSIQELRDDSLNSDVLIKLRHLTKEDGGGLNINSAP